MPQMSVNMAGNTEVVLLARERTHTQTDEFGIPPWPANLLIKQTSKKFGLYPWSRLRQQERSQARLEPATHQLLV